jgi:hypothetical protein
MQMSSLQGSSGIKYAQFNPGWMTPYNMQEFVGLRNSRVWCISADQTSPNGGEEKTSIDV